MRPADRYDGAPVFRDEAHVWTGAEERSIRASDPLATARHHAQNARAYEATTPLLIGEMSEADASYTLYRTEGHWLRAAVALLSWGLS